MKKTFHICPKCGSLNVESDTKEWLQDIAGMNPVFICRECKFSSYLFPLVDLEEAEKIKRELKKKDI